MKNLYQQVTDTILSSIDSAGDWKPCWVGATGMPKNGVTQRSYSGINVLLLWAKAGLAGYKQSRWATYQQWKGADCQVRKGEAGSTVLFYKTQIKADQPDESYQVARAFTVFNADQVDGDFAAAPPSVKLNQWELHDPAEQTIRSSGARLLHKGQQPCYVPALDEIWLPERQFFFDSEAYYATAFHELAHWTGHKDRCARELSTRFKTQAYAMEELVAELSAAFTMAEHGLTSRLGDEAPSYLRHWRDVLAADNGAIITAASAASKATAFILKTQANAQQEAA